MTGHAETTVGGHIPVMLEEVLDALEPRDDAVYIDATFGGGGVTGALLDLASCTVYAVDRDVGAVARAEALAQERPGVVPVEGCFGDLSALMAARGVEAVDGVVFDLGMSSFHLDTPERGFSFRFDGPLDMRMGADGLTAADLVNSLPEIDLARLLFEWGEERRARHIARAIVAARAEAPITTTFQLAALVRRVVPPSYDGIDPSTRTFQALRMRVNDEPGELRRGLLAAERLLRPGGRLVVISFHSIEDRIVKEFLRRRAFTAPAPSRHMPMSSAAPGAPSFTLITRRPVQAAHDETAHNPRARSARLRAAIRSAAPAVAPLPGEKEAE